jgi:hypothetical protein
MSGFSGSPRLLRAGLVLLDPATGLPGRTIALQYNPDTLSRTLQPKATGAEGGAGQSEALRLTGPAVETLKLDAEIDATDQLERPAENRATVQLGLHPALAVLETLVHPTTAQLLANEARARAGMLEIAPMESPLLLFVWSRNRVLPVRLTEFSIVEDAFDPALNPIRAKVSLGMRVLTVDDLGFAHRGGALFMAHQQQKERLASMARGGGLDALGLGGGFA